MPKGKRITEELRREVYSHWDNGMNKAEIGRRINLSEAAVANVIKNRPNGNKICPVCGKESNAGARYCWWCGGDIRSEADKLLERVVSMRAMIHHLPENMKNEFDGVTRDVIKYLGGEANGHH